MQPVPLGDLASERHVALGKRGFGVENFSRHAQEFFAALQRDFIQVHLPPRQYLKRETI
jgi:hypothetical protein